MNSFSFFPNLELTSVTVKVMTVIRARIVVTLASHSSVPLVLPASHLVFSSCA